MHGETITFGRLMIFYMVMDIREVCNFCDR